MTALLRVKNICKSFSGVQVLHNVDLCFNSGEVHALLGENGAGKTTLMRVICGIYHPEEGEIFFEEERVRFQNPRQSQEKGIAIIHQELNMPVNLSISDYIFLGHTPTNRLGLVKREYAMQKSLAALEMVEVNRNPLTKIFELTVAEQQLIEIARALSMNSRLIIMDEPTSALNKRETANLFRIIENLTQKGVAIIYISHKLDEIFQISDKITVMRDGKIIDSRPTEECTHELLVKMMTGKDLTDNYFAKAEDTNDASRKEVMMSVKNISTNKRNLGTVSFDLHKGEILGIAGLLGSGRTELLRAIFGADTKTSGEIILNGEAVKIRNTGDAVKAGIFYVAEDRKVEGLILEMSIHENIIIPSQNNLSFWGLLNKKKGKALSEEYVKQLRIKCTGKDQIVQNLSGGNQQKVVFAKWIAAHPIVFMLDDPTRGIDVGSKHEIYGLIRNLANQGIGIIFVSSEMPELVGVCDRVLVMRDGEIVSEAIGSNINENNLMMIATGK